MLSEANQDAVFSALGHATRRRLLDLLKVMPGATVNDVAKYFPISRIAVMKHLDVLEAADLLVSRRVGRMRQLYLNAVPLQLIHDRWATEYGPFWAGRLVDLKVRLEGPAGQPTCTKKRTDSEPHYPHE